MATSDDVGKTLNDLSSLIAQGLVSRDQVLSLFESKPQPQEQKEKINLQKILYYIGGFIVLLGIVFFIYQFWDEINQFSKTLLSLGSAVSAYALGYYFFTRGSKDFGNAFLVIAAALFPLGVGTSLDLLEVRATSLGSISVNLIILFSIYFVSFYYLRAAIFLPLSIFAASGFFFSFSGFLFQSRGLIDNFTEYRFIILGLSYISLGYYFSKGPYSFLTKYLYFFGLGSVLTVGLILQGFKDEANFFWQFIYPFLLVGVFYTSIHWQSKVFLLLGALFTIFQIIKFTVEYFSDSVGWPISLIVAGLVTMGIGYMSFELNKKYLKKPSG